MVDKEFEAFLEDLKRIENETMSLNESDEQDSNKDTDKENKSDSSSDSNSNEGDLDALLKDTENSSDTNKDNKESDDLDNIPDLNSDTSESSSKEEDNTDLGDLGLDNSNDSNTSDKDSTKNFETDSESLMDTITKLAKSGHKVTINVTSEGKQVFTYNNKRVSPKEIRTLAEIVLPKPKVSKEMKLIKSLSEQLNSLKRQLKGTTNIKPIQETKMIKISQDNYDSLVEMVTDLKFKVDEQEMIINNYKTAQSLMENDNYEDLDTIFKDLEDGVSEMNRSSLIDECNKAYIRSADDTITVMQEDVLPILSNLSEIKNNILNSFESSRSNTLLDSSSLSEAINYIDSVNKYFSDQNKMSRLTTLVESKLNRYSDINKSKVMSILSEATSDIIKFDGDYGYSQEFPKYDGFAKRVQDTINKAANGVNMNTSKIINYQLDTSDNLMSRSNVKKFDIPIARPDSIPGFDNDKITVRSAIMNLNEALVDIDGKLNLPLCEQAFLYKKVKNPTSLKDFAFPIAISENNRLVAVPKLIETVSNILKNESCIKTYGIDSRETFYNLRESLEPLMKECELSIPWKEDNLLDEAKKKVIKKSKKVKCKVCGGKFDPEELDKNGLCKECAKSVKKSK